MSTSVGDIQAIGYLKQAIAEGKHWYLALLDAIRTWSIAEEDHNGRHYRYLIDQEAFDWLVLAERLCEEIEGLIPENELIEFLFFDRPPLELSTDEFKELIGKAKYQAYLNYLYGVLVEEVLILAVAEEIRKKKRASGLANDSGTIDEAYQRIYGATQKELVNRFRRERHCPRYNSLSLGEIKEFTYWLFKQRVKTCEKSRVASDTSKALTKLHSYMRLKSRRVSHPS